MLKNAMSLTLFKLKNLNIIYFALLMLIKFKLLEKH